MWNHINEKIDNNQPLPALSNYTDQQLIDFKNEMIKYMEYHAMHPVLQWFKDEDKLITDEQFEYNGKILALVNKELSNRRKP